MLRNDGFQKWGCLIPFVPKKELLHAGNSEQFIPKWGSNKQTGRGQANADRYDRPIKCSSLSLRHEVHKNVMGYNLPTKPNIFKMKMYSNFPFIL